LADRLNTITASSILLAWCLQISDGRVPFLATLTRLKALDMQVGPRWLQIFACTVWI
jgi:hypothetical protein